MPKYIVTKAQCKKTISGVCPGCGGKLSPFETVDNSGRPTFWVGCNACGKFTHGIDRRYWKIARDLIEKDRVVYYRHMVKSDYSKDEESKRYWLDAQTSGLSPLIEDIHRSLSKEFNSMPPQGLEV